jgi:hypothetical protein
VTVSGFTLLLFSPSVNTSTGTNIPVDWIAL